MKKEGKPGDVVELANKEGGFTDPDSGFDISRDQQKELGEKIGARTQIAISSGGLLIIGDQAEEKPKKDDYDLPADIPGRDAFIAAGLTSFEKVKELNEQELLAINGIGPKTVKALIEWAGKIQPQK